MKRSKVKPGPAPANDDDDAEAPDYISNPLWMIAVGMVIFFAAAALLTTASG